LSQIDDPVGTGIKGGAPLRVNKYFIIEMKPNFRELEPPAVEKVFSYSICTKSFRNLTNLTVHSRVHRGEKPISCAICDKSFDHSFHLK